MNLGQHIVDSVVEAGAIESLIEDRDGGAKIFVWSSNANEQVEAAILKRMEGEIREFANNEQNMIDMALFIKIGQERGHPFQEIARRVIANMLLNFVGIDPDHPPK